MLDIEEANNKALQAYKENPDDGGTCNLDNVLILLPRAVSKDIVAFNDHVRTTFGIRYAIGPRILGGFHKGYYYFSVTSYGQANLRTRMAEAVYNYLKTKDYNVTMRYVMD
jgi:hypothetical protein